MSHRVSVIVPTHDPHAGRLGEALGALRGQSLGTEEWELIVVDNASARPLVDELDLSWHPSARVVREDRLGLTWARLRGFEEANAPLLILVDDDNLLAPDYLNGAVDFFAAHPDVGLAGGRVAPRYESDPPSWISRFHTELALRPSVEEDRIVAPGEIGSPAENEGAFRGGPAGCHRLTSYPSAAPIGAGMAIRREAAAAYAADFKGSESSGVILDRTGGSLASGGDNDIVLTVVGSGWSSALTPRLQLTHIIPPGRLDTKYLGRLKQGIARSWVGVLAKHGIRPWPAIPRWSLPARKSRAWVRGRAWNGPVAYIDWRGACGQFEGQADLS